MAINEPDRPTINDRASLQEVGQEQADLAPIFSRLLPDVAGSVDGVLDPDTLPLNEEPASVLSDLQNL